MGILNLTPDSFYDGGKHVLMKNALDKVAEMHEAGASIVDLGAFSSRPGAVLVDEEEEWVRLKDVLKEIKKIFPGVYISIDTASANVANRCLEFGADMINDISGGLLDVEMLKVVALHKAPYIGMHMRGTPDTMQYMTHYSHLMREVLDYFILLKERVLEYGITDLILDPGFGFAKEMEHNYELLSQLETLNTLENLILVGVSRKSMIYKTLSVSPSDALNGTTALHMTALMKGADILRVHDVKEAVESITLYNKLVK